MASSSSSAAAAATSLARSLFFTRPPTLPPRPRPPTVSIRLRPPPPLCLSSSGGESGVSDDFTTSTHKVRFDRGFMVISNMLKRIQPLDTSVVSQGVSESAKDSMKQTISSMLGLLPSDHFSVNVTASIAPLSRLLVSSIITGYTLWNAEYRISLMRNLDISPCERNDLSSPEQDVESIFGVENVVESDGKGHEVGGEVCVENFERSPNIFGDLSSEALNYIQQLQFKLSSAEEELSIQKQRSSTLEHERQNRNDLLEYLRSLDPDMVTELSRPSSAEVDDIINQLVENILGNLFKEDTSPFVRDSVISNVENHLDADNDPCDSISSSRDYLAKLLFWCMLMGHHLRGLENRLHLSCVVGLL